MHWVFLGATLLKEGFSQWRDAFALLLTCFGKRLVKSHGRLQLAVHTHVMSYVVSHL